MSEPKRQAAPIDGDSQKRPRIGRGLLIGALATALSLFVAMLALSYAYPALGKIKNAPPEAEWTKKMERLGVSLLYYAARHDGFLPPKLSALAKEGYVRDLSLFDPFGSSSGRNPSEAEIDGPEAKILYLAPKGKIEENPLAALKLNAPPGRVLLLCRKGLSWDASPEAPQAQSAR